MTDIRQAIRTKTPQSNGNASRFLVIPKRLIITAALVVASATTVHSAFAKVPARKMVEKVLKDSDVPSVSIARIEHFRVVWARAYGKQSPTKIATTRTLYNIASMTKPITAEVVMQLASRKVLSLDESMSPTWVDPDIASDPRTKLLTPRLALSHRTGFPNWRGDKSLAFANDPGTFSYSGEGYRYVATFTEKRTGERLDTLASRLIFQPLGMRETSYTQQPWFAGRIAQPFDTTGHWLTSTMTDAPVAADLIYSTPHDYAKFMIATMRDTGLTPALAAERRKVETDSKIACDNSASCPAERGITLGWEIARFGQRVYLQHTGRDPGIFNIGYLRPDTGSGVIIFTNGENGAKTILPLLHMMESDPEFIRYLEAR